MIHPIIVDSAGGEYMESVVVVEWSRKPGDRVTAGEIVVVVETAKAATEIPASHDGYLTEIFFEAGAEAPVGALLGNIGDSPQETAAAGPGDTARPEAAQPAAPPEPAAALAAAAPAGKPGRIVATPLARRLAQLRDVDLSRVRGTGPNGRIKSRDVAAAGAARSDAAPARAVAALPIVFLHGFGADSSAWRLVAPLIDPRHRIVLPELPGHGSAAEVPVSRIEDIAFAVSDALDALGIEEAHVVGHSLGGATALALSATGRLRIRSLCLIAPGGLGEDINAAFLDGLVRAATPEELQPWLEQMVADPARLPRSMARSVLRQRERDGSREAQERLLGALFAGGVQGMRLIDELRAVNVPTKIVWGLQDAVIPSSHAFAAPGSAALHLLQGVGHVPQQESPELVARLIGELVRSAS